MRLLGSVVILPLVLLLVSCKAADPQNTLLGTHGHVAADIAKLSWGVFWAAAVVFVLVEGMLLYILVRYRDRGDRELPVQVHGHTKLEITWTIVPTLLLAGVAVPTLFTLIHIDTIPKDSMTINVTAHQWWWEFQYPDGKFTTADEMHIPVNRNIHLILHSNDVIHGFWVPKLAGKTEVIPNHDNEMWIDATEANTYSAQCTEFCGEEHALMRFEVIAQPQAEFNSWMVGQQAQAADLGHPGAQTFLKGPCVACHAIGGTAAVGNVGPNLTHFASRAWFEEMDNNPDDVAKWLHNPQAVKPGNLMPNYNLSDQDIQSLVGFLEGLK
ncbi:MAG: cytochrome c oxidase subunit II [Dehalococcoidia bacterium]